MISGVLAFIATFLTALALFGGLHIFSTKQYNTFLSVYNTNEKVMLLILGMLALTFVSFFLVFFLKRMDAITRYISEIGECVNQIAKGKLTTQIPIRNQHELGELAININQMTTDLNIALEKERTWDKQKYNLITNLSHDLKTPLMSVMGFLELIYYEKYENKEQLKHYSEVAFNKTKELKESIDKLFELSKLSNTDIVLNKIPIHILELTEQVVMGFIPALEAKQMAYYINAERKDIILDGDALLIARVYENLISNAIKYGEDGKCVDIKIQENNRQTVVIHFINYGQAISKEAQEKLFGRFYRASKSSEAKEGTGLGLAIVKSIVALHNGQVMVESSEEKTEFIVELPIK